jgi:hypothetical protein
MRGVLVGEVALGLAIRGRQIAHGAASARNLAEGLEWGRRRGLQLLVLGVQARTKCGVVEDRDVGGDQRDGFPAASRTAR